MTDKVVKTDEEWQRELTPEQYYCDETERNGETFYQRPQYECI